MKGRVKQPPKLAPLASDSAALLTELVAHLRENRTQLREEWARRRQTVYFDMENLNPATRALSAYASPAEIEAAIASMKSLRR